MPFVLAAVDRALVGSTPTILNSDQGSHFTSRPYLERLHQSLNYRTPVEVYFDPTLQRERQQESVTP